MRAKEYLNQVKLARDQVVNLDEEVKERRQMLFSITSAVEGERVQTSFAGDKTSDRYILYAEKAEEALTAYTQYLKFKERVKQQIMQLQNERYRDVLLMKYIYYNSLGDIAEKRHYDYKYILNIHGYALIEFENVFKEMLERMPGQ